MVVSGNTTVALGTAGDNTAALLATERGRSGCGVRWLEDLGYCSKEGCRGGPVAPATCSTERDLEQWPR